MRASFVPERGKPLRWKLYATPAEYRHMSQATQPKGGRTSSTRSDAPLVSESHTTAIPLGGRSRPGGKPERHGKQHDPHGT